LAHPLGSAVVARATPTRTPSAPKSARYSLGSKPARGAGSRSEVSALRQFGFGQWPLTSRSSPRTGWRHCGQEASCCRARSASALYVCSVVCSRSRAACKRSSASRSRARVCGTLAAAGRELAFELRHGLLVGDRLEAPPEQVDNGSGEGQTDFGGVGFQGLLERVRNPGVDDRAHRQKTVALYPSDRSPITISRRPWAVRNASSTSSGVSPRAKRKPR